uniref:Uncharacterized protein n=1 Tax=Glossina austeni TaxID=7395 RepID=A0A1A9UVD9_GLOAU
MHSNLLPVSKPAPSGLQRPVLIAAACAVMLLSTRPLLFNMTKRPSLLQISKVSLPLPPPLPRPPNSSQCKSVGIKSSGSLATSTESRNFPSSILCVDSWKAYQIIDAIKTAPYQYFREIKRTIPPNILTL